MPLYEIAILEMPEKKKDGEGVEKLVYGPEHIIAKSDKAAANKALIQNADKLAEVDPDRIQVLVRPF